MKILLVSDYENPALWDYYCPGKLDGIDVIISCGDLKAECLEFLVTMGRAPVLDIHGNHDGRYKKCPPEGCDCIEDDLVKINGLRIAGLGGCMAYNGGAHQYTERQMWWRVLKLCVKILLAGGVDVLVTHAPVSGCGDSEHLSHRGFKSFLWLLERFRPKFWVHGHMHLNYGRNPRTIQRGETTVINAYGSYLLEL